MKFRRGIALAVMLAAAFKASPAPAPTSGARSEMIVTDADRQHWSFLPLANPSLPAVKNTAPVRTPVDRFVLAALEQKQLTPSPPANARTLVRRIYFDLIGLPPTPEQVAAFVQASALNSRAAVAALVDELIMAGINCYALAELTQ